MKELMTASTVSPYIERHLIEQLFGAHGEILHGFLNFEFCTIELFIFKKHKAYS